MGIKKIAVGPNFIGLVGRSENKEILAFYANRVNPKYVDSDVTWIWSLSSVARYSWLNSIKGRSLLYPQQNRVLGGYTVFSMSVIPSFCDLRVLLYTFDSFCPILFKFTPHLDHRTMHV